MNNINSNGSIFLDILKDNLNSVLIISIILQSISSLIADPNSNDHFIQVISWIFWVRCWFMMNHIKIYQYVSHNYKSIFMTNKVIFLVLTHYFTFFGGIPNGPHFMQALLLQLTLYQQRNVNIFSISCSWICCWTTHFI